MIQTKQKTSFLDCTIRDGGYINRWDFSDDSVTELIHILDKCGYDFIEIGFRNNPQIYNNKPCGKWRYCREKDLVKVVVPKKDRNIKIAVMADYTSSSIDLFPTCNETVIDMVRVAFHISDFEGALEMCKQLKQLGYIVSANAMATMNYTKQQMTKLCKLSHNYKIDYLYIADSYGCLVPGQVTKLYNLMRGLLPSHTTVKLGLHAHNNIQNALSNALSSDDDVDIIDSTVFGMGRGAGNLCTELIIHEYYESTNLLKVCEYAEKWIVPLYSNTPTEWGYNLPFVISAHFKCHPNYVSKLKDYGITKIKDVWEYMQIINNNKKNNYFDLEYLNELVATKLGRFF